MTGYEMVGAGWLSRAACRGLDPDLFFAGRGESTDPAKAVCATCPVAAECAEYAAVLGQSKGVWGGLSERQKRAAGRPVTPRRLPPPHGTDSRYHRGCRCARCGEAMAAAAAERRTRR